MRELGRRGKQSIPALPPSILHVHNKLTLQPSGEEENLTRLSPSTTPPTYSASACNGLTDNTRGNSYDGDP